MENISNDSVSNPQRGGSKRYLPVMPASDPTAPSDRWVFGGARLILAVVALLPVALGPPEFTEWPGVGLYLLLVVIVVAFPIRPQQEQPLCLYYVVKPGYLIMYLGLSRPQSRFRLKLANCSRAILGDIRHPKEMRLQLCTPWGWTFSVPPLEDMEEFVAEVAAQLPVEIERQNAPTRLPLSHGLLVGAVLLTISLVGFLCLSLMLY